MKTLSIVHDGGCRNNQGINEQRQMYGSMKVQIDSITTPFTFQSEAPRPVFARHEIESWEGDMGIRSNNVAEMEMALTALRYVEELCERSLDQGKNVADKFNVELHTDSQLVIGYMTGRSKVGKKAQHLAPLRQLGLERIEAIRALGLDISYVKRTDTDIKAILGH